MNVFKLTKCLDRVQSRQIKIYRHRYNISLPVYRPLRQPDITVRVERNCSSVPRVPFRRRPIFRLGYGGTRSLGIQLPYSYTFQYFIWLGN
jgi:hypothetical protein